VAVAVAVRAVAPVAVAMAVRAVALVAVLGAAVGVVRVVVPGAAVGAVRVVVPGAVGVAVMVVAVVAAVGRPVAGGRQTVGAPGLHYRDSPDNRRRVNSSPICGRFYIGCADSPRRIRLVVLQPPKGSAGTIKRGSRPSG